MEKQQYAGGIAVGRDRPFAGHAVDVDRIEPHVIGCRPNGADLVEALAPFRPPDGSWFGAQQFADGVNFIVTHWRDPANYVSQIPG